MIFGTDNGVWTLEKGTSEQIALAGKDVSHVAARDGIAIASVPRDGLYDVSDGGDKLVWQGDARACAIGPDGAFYVGIEPAMVFRSSDGGETWTRSDKIDDLPTRESWYFPPPPHEPHVRSIDFLPDDSDSVLAGVEVGGVLLSRDRGSTWAEMNNGVHVDVHTVRPDPSGSGLMVACTGGGLYVSEDNGGSWEQREEGLGQGYAVGLHINPKRAGEVIIATGQRPPGLDAQVYHSVDAGRNWNRVNSASLPDGYSRVPVVMFAEDAAWIATDKGAVYRSDDINGDWSLVCEVPATINAAASEGSPCSVSSGHR